MPSSPSRKHSDRRGQIQISTPGEENYSTKNTKDDTNDHTHTIFQTARETPNNGYKSDFSEYSDSDSEEVSDSEEGTDYESETEPDSDSEELDDPRPFFGPGFRVYFDSHADKKKFMTAFGF